MADENPNSTPLPPGLAARLGDYKAKERDPTTNTCYGCKTVLSADDAEGCHCPGCGKVICEDCDVNWNMPLGNHSPDLHMQESEDDGGRW